MTLAGKALVLKPGMIFFRPPKMPYTWEYLTKTTRYIEVTIQPTPRWEPFENAGPRSRNFEYMQQFNTLVEELILIKNSAKKEKRNSALANASLIAEMLELERDSVAGDLLRKII